MKTFTAFISLSFTTILLIFSINAYAIKHIVTVANFSFSPASVNVNVGDTMRWVWSSGTHTTTSTTIPAGASTWDSPITSLNPAFEYKVTIAGTYHYFCKIHGLGMSGSFIAANVTPTLSVTPSNQNVTSASGSTAFGVSSNSAWTASSNQVWCTATSGGPGNGTITADYSENPAVNQRVASITVTVQTLPSQTVTVTQEGAPALTAIASTTTPAIFVGQTAQLDVSASGGTGVYTYVWTSNPAGFTSIIKSPTDIPASATKYICEVTSGDQTASDSITVNVTLLPDTEIILQNDTIFNGQSRCYGATQTITVAGNNTSLIVDSTGSATMVAGQNILYLPGTLVIAGGYMHGYISTDGQYCITPFTPIVLVQEDLKGIPQKTAQTVFRIFPNPTTGLFTVELSNDLTSSPVTIDVMSMNGQPVLNEKFNGKSGHEFSLDGHAVGIYFVRLISGNKTETTKIIKQ